MFQAAPAINVRVTEQHADEACVADQYNCALARAIQDRFDDAIRVRVNTKSVAFTRADEDTRYIYPTTQRIINDIIKPNDDGGRPEPGSYQLTDGIVKPVAYTTEKARLQEKRQRERSLVGSPAKENRGSVVLKRTSPNAARYLRFAPDA